MVLASDMKAFLSSTVATSFSTANVGGAISANLFNGDVGQLLFTMAAEAQGGSDKIQHGKFFIKNDHATDTINTFGIWLRNALDDIGSATTVTLVSDNAGDDGTTTAVVLGFSAGGVAQSEEVALNGTTNVITSLTYLGRIRVYLKNTSTGALKNAVGEISVTAGSLLGVIPAGYGSATAEIDIGAEATLNDSATIADASTAPSGITFTRPRTEAGKLILDNGTGTLEAQEANGVWARLTLVAGMNPTESVDCVIRGKGNAV